MRASADGCVTIAVVARVTDLGRTGHTDGGRTARAPACGAEQAPPIESIRELYLEVTNRCNSLCQTCPLTFGPHEAERDLSLDEMRHVVEQCPGLERVVLHGIGEPLLNRELPGMIGWLADRGLLTVFNTNAIALSERRGDRIVEAGLDSLRISIDGATRATYELLRGVDALDKVLANARAFRRRHPEAPDCEVFFTCSRANLHELPALVRLVAQIGIHTLNVQRLVYWEQGMAREELALYRDLSQQETALLGAARTAAEREGVRLTASGGTDPESSLSGQIKPRGEGCARPWNLVYVTCHGSLLPCCISPFTGVPFEQLVLGNVLEQPLAELWANGRYQRLRAGLAGGGPVHAACHGCGERWPY